MTINLVMNSPQRYVYTSLSQDIEGVTGTHIRVNNVRISKIDYDPILRDGNSDEDLIVNNLGTRIVRSSRVNKDWSTYVAQEGVSTINDDFAVELDGGVNLSRKIIGEEVHYSFTPKGIENVVSRMNIDNLHLMRGIEHPGQKETIDFIRKITTTVGAWEGFWRSWPHYDNMSPTYMNHRFPRDVIDEYFPNK